MVVMASSSSHHHDMIMSEYANRFLAFANAPGTFMLHTISTLAKNGFYPTKAGATIKCYYCNVTLPSCIPMSEMKDLHQCTRTEQFDDEEEERKRKVQDAEVDEYVEYLMTKLGHVKSTMYSYVLSYMERRIKEVIATKGFVDTAACIDTISADMMDRFFNLMSSAETGGWPANNYKGIGRSHLRIPSCNICFQNPVSIVLTPCGHAVTCNSCWSYQMSHGSTNSDQQQCPLCRAQVAHSYRLFY